MYIPQHYRNEDQTELLACMRAYPFATLVTAVSGEPLTIPLITHLPLVIVEEGGQIRISGHVASGNPHWRAFGAGATVAIFHGPHAYVSPAVYDSSKSVPTWNYVAIHASGPVAVIEDPVIRSERILELVTTTDVAYHPQWDALPVTYRDAMLNGIVAFDLTVSLLEGKYKLSQNKTPAEQTRIAEMLLHADDPAAQATGRLMQQRNDGSVLK